MDNPRMVSESKLIVTIGTEILDESKTSVTDRVPIVPIDYTSYISQIQNAKDSMSVWEIIKMLLTYSPKVIRTIFIILRTYSQIKEILSMDNDKKTTFLATVKTIIGAIAVVAGLFGHSIGDDIQTAIIAVAGGLYLIISWLIGLFTNKPETAK